MHWNRFFQNEVSPDLCNTCQDIFKDETWKETYNWPDDWVDDSYSKSGIHHRSYKVFQNAVEQGCHICVALYNTLPVNLSPTDGNMDSVKAEFSNWSIYGTRGKGRDSRDCGGFSVKLGSWATTDTLRRISVPFNLLRIDGES
jgi:hypothetical protein